MPLITAEQISTLAVELLARTLVLPQSVARVPRQDYSGSGGTVIVRVPQRRTALEQMSPGDPITPAGIDETPVQIVVRHLYDAAPVTDEDLTLAIISFGVQVLQPLVASVAEAAEDILGGAINGVAPSFGWTDLTDPAKTEADILLARQTLTENDVPLGGRFLAVAPDVASVLLSLDKFSKVNESGSPGALRDAILGRIFGLWAVETNALEAGTAVGYHRSAFVFASLAPATPAGAASSATSVAQGIALRAVRDFDVSHLTEIAAVSCFAGASLVDADRAVRIASES